MTDNRYPTFGQALTGWMNDHRYSCHRLADALGIKSATTVSRLRLDRCKVSSCEEFLSLLESTLPVTEQERYRLHLGIDVLKYGTSYYENYTTFDHVIFGEQAQVDENLPIVQAFAALKNASRCEVLCLHCVVPEVFAAFQALLRETTGSVEIRHFVSLERQQNLNCYLDNALPLIANSAYHAKLLLQTSRLGMPASNFLLVRYLENGQLYQRLILPRDGGEYNCCPLDRDSALFDFFYKIINNAAPDSSNVVDILHMNMVKDINQLFMRKTAEEKNSEILLLSSDLFMSVLPTDVLVGSMCRHLMLNPLDSEIINLRSQFYLKRANLLQKKQPTIQLTSRRTFERLAREGLTPYTSFVDALMPIRDRRIILQSILEAMEKNPNFRVHLSSSEEIFSQTTILLTDKRLSFFNQPDARHIPNF
ncbi:MAG: hypothetical protein Q4C54_08190 [Clostridia bacterium]|nr:hypothetical protein [Clostridia bacterium]